LSIAGSPITTSGTLAFTLSGTALPTTSGGTGLTSFTSGGVVYASSSSALATGSALTFDGTTLQANKVYAPLAISIRSSTFPNNYNLHVSQDDSTAALAKFTNTTTGVATTDGFDVGINSAEQAYVWNNENTAMLFGVNNSEGMRLTSTGLGIGTSSPAQLLDVQSATSPTIRISNSKEWTSGDSGVIAAYQFYTKDASTPNGTKIAAYINSENYAGSSVPEGILTFGTSAGGGSSANATEKMRLDSSGNLGLGVTPSAWYSANKAIDIGTRTALWSGGAGQPNLGYNCYVNTSGNFIYKASDIANYYSQDGAHKWFNAASGTAGNAITFTQAMTLDASGNLGVGYSSPSSFLYSGLTVGGGTGNIGLTLFSSTTGIGSIAFADSASGAARYAGHFRYLHSSNAFTFDTEDVERMRLTSTGLGIGTSSPSASAILDAQSTTKGVRMPNMTTTQKNAIASPAAGLMVFDTTLAKLCVYTGSAWQTITST